MWKLSLTIWSLKTTNFFLNYEIQKHVACFKICFFEGIVAQIVATLIFAQPVFIKILSITFIYDDVFLHILLPWIRICIFN